MGPFCASTKEAVREENMRGWIFIVAVLAAGCGERVPGARESLIAVKAVVSLDAAEADYFTSHRRFGSLAELRAEAGDSVRGDLERAREAGFRLGLILTEEGYDVTAQPDSSAQPSLHSFFSDQTGVVRIHAARGPATSADPAIDDRLRKPAPRPFHP